MNDLLSYCGLVDAKIRASYKDVHEILTPKLQYMTQCVRRAAEILQLDHFMSGKA